MPLARWGLYVAPFPWHLYESGGCRRERMKHLRTLIFILVVVIIAVYFAWPTDPGIHFLGIDREIKTRFGLDLVGGVQVLLEADVPADQPVSSDSMDTAARIVSDRVGGLTGATEAVVQRAGERFIVVEIPDVQDPEQAVSTIKETALLEFVDFSVIPEQEALALWQSGATIKTDYLAGSETITPTVEITPTLQPTETISPTQAITSTGTITATPESPSRVFHTVMTGEAIDSVAVQVGQAGGYVVAFKLTPEGSKIFADFTSQHVGDILAIVLDKKVISAPSINQAITEGSGVIEGNFTQEEADALTVQLLYGALPVPLKVVETRTVGATLGADSLNKSILAGAIGFSIVILFMVLYYRLPGVIATLAILLYALVTYALFRFIPVTLTLPGIAGLMLSTGSALDANILIFERLKEELRSGRALSQAVDLAWRRAWPSIRDANLATIITSLILFWFGSSFGATIVKGFSFTLLIGVLVSLFTAILVTRTFLALVLSWIKPSDPVQWFGL